jgi:hypothetical protein
MTGPQTYHEASSGSLPEQIARYHELSERDLLAGSIATLKARGTYQPTEHVNDERFPPLTVAEHLEMLALGEVIARYYRHPSQVDRAVRAGATWQQIADATGTTEAAARAAYREWAEGQHKYACMGDAEYAAAIKAAGEPDAAAVHSGTAEDTRRLEAIRAVLAGFDWEHDDRQLALEEIARIAGGGQP